MAFWMLLLAVIGLVIGLGIFPYIKLPKIAVGILGIAAAVILLILWLQAAGLESAASMLDFILGWQWLVGLATGVEVGAFIRETFM